MSQANPPDLSYSEPDMRYEVSDPRPLEALLGRSLAPLDEAVSAALRFGVSGAPD